MALSKPTAIAVKEIVTTGKSDSVVSSIIDDAALMVEDCVSSLTAERQEAIIKYVAAHVIALSDAKGSGAVSSEKLGDAQKSYAAAHLGQHIHSTSYGQQAVMLDPNGCIAQIGKRPAKVRLA